jgi:hypothetical protein
VQFGYRKVVAVPIGQGGVDHRKVVPYVRVQFVIGELVEGAPLVINTMIEGGKTAMQRYDGHVSPSAMMAACSRCDTVRHKSASFMA